MESRSWRACLKLVRQGLLLTSPGYRDISDFAARWGIALQAGILKGDARLRDPAAFCESLEAVEVTRCDKNPVSLDELADSSRSVIAAHAKGAPISDLLDELAALTALV
jgi:hypothetical protein